MKYLVLAIIVIVVSLCGCIDIMRPQDPYHKHDIVEKQPNGDYVHYTITIIDGCQYIYIGPYLFAHKGNCTNLFHRSSTSTIK